MKKHSFLAYKQNVKEPRSYIDVYFKLVNDQFPKRAMPDVFAYVLGGFDTEEKHFSIAGHHKAVVVLLIKVDVGEEKAWHGTWCCCSCGRLD